MVHKEVRPDRPDVPDKPTEFGDTQCVFGHLITDKHVNFFRAENPELSPTLSINAHRLVMHAMQAAGHSQCRTTVVYDKDNQNSETTCLIYLDYRGHRRVPDLRPRNAYRETMEKVLGIDPKKNIPKWYRVVPEMAWEHLS